MDETLLRSLSLRFLVPLFSGAHLDTDAVSSTPQEQLVALVSPCAIAFRVSADDKYRLVLRRSQPFAQVTNGRITESAVVQAFVDVIPALHVGLGGPYEEDLRAGFARRVVAKALDTHGGGSFLREVLYQFSLWATQQYEGKPIAAAIGLIDGVPGTKASFAEMSKEAFSAVLSNGIDTLLTCNNNGEVLGHETLKSPESDPSCAPYRFAAMAHWTADARLALTLNRTGEVFIFRDRELCFAYRGGRWHFPTHDPALTQMGGPQNAELRRAVYETALDASIARSGACIGIVTSGNAGRWEAVVPSADDHLDFPRSTKGRVLSNIVAKRKFQELNRRLRAELVAIDGATIMDHNGKILAVGAILKIPGGSTGGGRLAAAKALSTLGVGIKVSQDGSIEGFANQASRFQVM